MGAEIPTPQDPLHAARAYLERGWIPLPVRAREKIPLIPWRTLASAPPTPQAIEEWWRRWPDANVGIITGAASHLAVLDFDNPEIVERAAKLGLPTEALRARTARAMHLYCAANSLVRTMTLWPGLEVRGEGAYVVAPPSIHSSGVRYSWIVSPDRDLPPLPEWCRQPSKFFQQAHRPDWVARALRGVEEGRRNVTCAQLAGYFLGKGVRAEVINAILLSWNRLNHPPLSEVEVDRTVASLATRDFRRRVIDLPTFERSLFAFLANPLSRTCTHGERSTYQAICVIGWQRGLTPGAWMFVSYSELTLYGGVSPQHARDVLNRLAQRGLIGFQPAGRGAGLHGLAARIRLASPLSPEQR